MADNLSETYSQSIEPDAHNIHVLVHDGELMKTLEMQFTPEVAAYFKRHAGLEGKELDTGKMEAEGIPAEPGKTYFAFEDFSNVVAGDYNRANAAAHDLYNKITETNTDPDDDTNYTTTNLNIAEISQTGDLDGFSRSLNSMRNNLEISEDLSAEIIPTIEALQDASALAKETGQIFHDNVRDYGPGLERPDFDFDRLRADSVETPGIAPGAGQ